ncbi:MAG: methyltransferase domain-containing protein [archaeon]
MRYHEIAERYRHILNPFSHSKLIRVAHIAGIRKGMQVLDLACGKGEMLCQWARCFGISGVGVDRSNVFLEAARKRAKELSVVDHVEFVEGDAGNYAIETNRYNVICCIGATWIRGSLDGTLQFMQSGVSQGGLLIVGEPFWRQPPLPEEYKRMLTSTDLDFRDLAGTLNRIELNGIEPISMVLANEDDWDRYETANWRSVQEWVHENPKDNDAAKFLEIMRRERETYLRWGRSYLGWGVFIGHKSTEE